MKKLILILTVIGITSVGVASAQLRVFTPPQGGTGIGSASPADVGLCLKVLDDSPFTYEFATCGSGGGGGGAGTFATSTAFGGILYNYPLNATDIVVVGYDGSGVATSTNEGEFYVDPAAKLAGFLNGTKVGIGTTSPYAALSVVGQTVSAYFTATTTATSTLPTVLTGGGAFEFHNSGKLLYECGSFLATAIISLCRDGDILAFGPASGDATLTAMLGADVNGNEVGLMTIGDEAIAIAVENGSADYYGYGGYTATNYGALRIDKTSGDAHFIEKLGIGTSSPYAKLSVVGEVVAAYFTATTTTASSFPLANITKLSNLTSNGFVKTSGGDGTLSVDTTTYESGLTAGDALTRTANDFDFDGGASPSGDLGGTWASPSVTDDSHAHTSGTLSGIDISADTNAAATWPIILTNDTFSFGGLSTTTALATNNILYATGVNTVGSESAFTYVPGTDSLTVVSASTTQMSVSSKLYAPMSSSILLSATTTMGNGTTTIKISGFSQDWDFTEFGCTSYGSGTFKAQIGDSTATSTLVTSSTNNTTTFTTLSANNSFTRGEAFYIAFGSVSGTVSQPSCSYTRVTK